jgi:fatty-acyl-CoA synthase
MRALMMDQQLTITAIARRAQDLSAERAVVSHTVDGDVIHVTWAQTIDRARSIAAALSALGVRPGDRVASLCWNQQEHLDLYFGVPMMGAILQPLNARLSADQLAAILDQAESRVLVADHSLLALLSDVLERTQVGTVIVARGGDPPRGTLSYDELLADHDPSTFKEVAIDELDACTLCFTTGTTGRPKGVLYSHRSVALQALMMMAADFSGMCEADTVLILVPMFHANAWNHPYGGALAGSKVVLPHSDLRPERVLELIEGEHVTITGGVPTLWEGILAILDAEPARYDISSLRAVRIGGSRMPPALIRGLEERHHVPVLSGFGMTELGPVAGLVTIPAGAELSEQERWRYRAKAGRPFPFLEVRARGDDGRLVARDGEAVGELEYRGPSVASAYWHDAEPEAFTDDGWLRSGDIGSIDRFGLVDIPDRKKDLIKSGGEWISSVELEQLLSTHPAVADAAVIAIPDQRWQERPLAVIVLAPGREASEHELLDHVRPNVPRWWLPDRVVFVSEIPRTSVGKIKKAALREQFA